MHDPPGPAPEQSPDCPGPSSENTDSEELLLPFSDFERKPLCEVVPGTPLVEKRTSCLYGQSGDGKTFVALEWIFSAAEHAPVLYVAGEDEEEARKRAVGYADFFKIPERTKQNIAFYPDRIRALDPRFEDVRQIIAACKRKDFFPRLVVVDTLGACFEGLGRPVDPVDGTACRVFLSACSLFQRELGAATLFVHHTRKDATTFYGNNILRTNSRAVFRTEKTQREANGTPAEYVTVVQEKNKSGACIGAQTYKLCVHSFKFRGKFVTTCIPLLQKEAIRTDEDGSLSREQLKVLIALSSKMNPSGLTRPDVDAVLKCKKDKSIRILRSLGIDRDGLDLVEPNPEGPRNIPRYRLSEKGRAAADFLLDSGKTWREFLDTWGDQDSSPDPLRQDDRERGDEQGDKRDVDERGPG